MTKQKQNETVQYTTAISKGAGMIEETRRLLEYWRPDEDLDDFAKRVHEQGLLGNATAYRTGDIVRRVFAPRFLKPDDTSAHLLQIILRSGLSGRTFNEFLFLFTARQDPLVYDFTIREYWPSARRGKTILGTDTGVSFLSEAHYEGRLDNQWSENTMIRISRCLLGLLKDVGFLREIKRGTREIVDYRMSDEGVALFARLLHESGVTDSSLCDHPDWRLFGLSTHEALDRLDALGEHRGVFVQRAGSVVHFTWTVKSVQELIDVLA